MTITQQKVINAIELLSDDQLNQLIQFVDFLIFSENNMENKTQNVKVKRKPGVFTGPVIMSPDFFETPDCFKEYK